MEQALNAMPGKISKRKISSRPLPGAGLRLIFLGLSLWFLFGIYRIYELKILSFSGQIASQIPSGPTAVQINIPKINLSSPVTEATVTDGTWEISPDGASHWNNSANPGNGNNVVIYSHNKTNLFGPIRWLELDDEIVLTDADGNEHRYQISETLTVSPKQTKYILPKNEETLTLYTCTGLFDSQRYLVIAKPID